MTIQTFAAGQTLTASQMNTLQASDFNFTRNVQTGTAYTLVITDRGKLLEFSNAGSISLTIPTNAAVAFEIGDRVDVLLTSNGSVAIAGASGVTIAAEGGLTTISSQWTRVTLIKRTTDDWVITGGSGEVQTAEIEDGAITESKLATGSVTSDKILDGTIVNADINAAAAIALSKLATGALPTAITVASANIVNETIVNEDVSSSAAIAYSKLSLSSSISTTDLATGAARAGFRSTGAGSTVTLTSNNYDILVGDLAKLIEVGPTAANATVTITSANDANFAVGDRIDVLQTTGTYVVTLQGSGVTINAFDGALKLQGQWACATLIKRATNTWVAVGNLTT
jgi:urease beta subunit